MPEDPKYRPEPATNARPRYLSWVALALVFGCGAGLLVNPVLCASLPAVLLAIAAILKAVR
jgi:hypothetical protein